MPPTLQPDVRGRAFALAAVRALGDRAENFLRPRSPALADFAATLRDPAVLAAESSRLTASRPEGIEQIEASWYTPAPLSRSPAAQLYLDRLHYGHLVAMGAHSPLDEVDTKRLVRLLERLGQRRVAMAFRSAEPSALAQLCARVGEPGASALLREVKELGAIPANEVKAAQRALFRQVLDDLEAAKLDARGLFLRAGAGWLAPALRTLGADEVARVAQRLPRPYGDVLLSSADGAVDPTVLDTAYALLK